MNSTAKTNWNLFWFGFFVAVYAAYLQFKLTPALPEMLRLYRYDPMVAGAFMSVYAILGFFLSPLIGRWLSGPRVKQLILAVLAISVLAQTAALFVSPSGLLMLLTRTFEAIAFAAFAIGGPVIVGQAASDKFKPLGIGISSTWMPCGILLSSFAYYWLGDDFGWSILWSFGVVIGASLFIWAALSQFSGGQGQAKTHPQDLRLTRHEEISLLMPSLVFVFWSLQFNAYMTWFTTYVTNTLGYNPVEAVWVFMLPVLVIAMVNLPVGLAQSNGKITLTLLTLGLIIQALSWLMGLLGDPLFQLLALISYGVGAGIVPSSLFGCPKAIVDSSKYPFAFSRMMTGRYIGVLLGPILIGLAIRLNISWDLVMGIAALLTTIPLIFVALLYRRLY